MYYLSVINREESKKIGVPGWRLTDRPWLAVNRSPMHMLGGWKIAHTSFAHGVCLHVYLLGNAALLPILLQGPSLFQNSDGFVSEWFGFLWGATAAETIIKTKKPKSSQPKYCQNHYENQENQKNQRSSELFLDGRCGGGNIVCSTFGFLFFLVFVMVWVIFWLGRLGFFGFHNGLSNTSIVTILLHIFKRPIVTLVGFSMCWAW